MGKRTIYVRDADTPMWRRAEQIAGPNLSNFLAEALREYLQRDEFREVSMKIDRHGEVVKVVRHIWGSPEPDGRSAWGTSFETDGTGPEQAAALVEAMKSDPEINHIMVEDRRVFADNWVDRRVLEEWTRNSAGWALAT